MMKLHGLLKKMIYGFIGHLNQSFLQ